MAIKNYNVIGVMSGTSLDGIDFAFAKISVHPKLKAQIKIAETVSYSPQWKEKLQAAVHLTTEELSALNKDYTDLLASEINGFIERNTISYIDAICSHGHTVLHQPEKGLTLQIGNLPVIATLLKQTVVCDFRVQDIALGGQGAPLVPIGDALLFSHYDYCLNLGGFANVSQSKNGTRIAYDICPVNVVLNQYAQQLGYAYDDEGGLAKTGNVDSALLQALNRLEFYTNSPPKSLGMEWVQAAIFPLLKASNLSPKDVLATFTEHIAVQLAAQFKAAAKVLVTGGGAYNSYLLDRVATYKKLTLHLPSPQLIEFKEALIFALLGVLKLENEVNCLASVTGASRDHSSGVIFKY